MVQALQAAPLTQVSRVPVAAPNDPGVLPGSTGLFAIHGRNRPLGIGVRWLLQALQQQAWFDPP